jgi:hypothetical protein
MGKWFETELAAMRLSPSCVRSPKTKTIRETLMMAIPIDIRYNNDKGGKPVKLMKNKDVANNPRP